MEEKWSAENILPEVDRNDQPIHENISSTNLEDYAEHSAPFPQFVTDCGGLEAATEQQQNFNNTTLQSPQSGGPLPDPRAPLPPLHPIEIGTATPSDWGQSPTASNYQWGSSSLQVDVEKLPLTEKVKIYFDTPIPKRDKTIFTHNERTALRSTLPFQEIALHPLDHDARLGLAVARYMDKRLFQEKVHQKLHNLNEKGR